jgi:hypothetical protein
MIPRFLARTLGYVAWLLLPATVSWSQNFSVAVSPQSVTIYPGQQNVPLTVTASGLTSAGPINIALTGLPSGISVSPLTLAAGEAGTIYLSASLSADQEDFSPDYPSTNTTAAHNVVVNGGWVEHRDGRSQPYGVDWQCFVRA